MKSSRVELRGPEMAFGIVRCADTLTGDPQDVCIQFAVGVLVVENRYGVRPGSNARELADRMPVRYLRFPVGGGLVAILGKARGRRKEGAQNLAFGVAQTSDFDVNIIRFDSGGWTCDGDTAASNKVPIHEIAMWFFNTLQIRIF